MANPSRQSNPAARNPVPTSSQPTPAGTRFQDRSRAALIRLSQLPPLVIPGVMLALMLIGLMAPLVFAVPALVVIAVFVGWLAILSWPVLETRARLLRGVLLGIVVVTALGRVQGWL